MFKLQSVGIGTSDVCLYVNINVEIQKNSTNIKISSAER